jgi:hypothetical protein
MKTGKTLVREFIKNNGLDFSGLGSDLNGNCVVLAGFICHITVGSSAGRGLITDLKLPKEAEEELSRVFEYAYANDYANFWETPNAKELYIF